MNGIYIPGMEMPTGDNNITLFLYPDGKVVVCGMLGPLGHYEAIPVPPHGRLGDLDALYEKFLRLESESMSALQTTSVGSEDGIKRSAILTERTGYKFDIVDAPTIIPASEEGTGNE